MTRTFAGALLMTAVAAGIVVAGLSVQRDLRYRSLIATGNHALAMEQTFSAIEAFSGAIALKDDSMIAYLRRGEAYRKRGEPESALRDFRLASRLDRNAARPAELQGDVEYDLGRFAAAAEAYRRCVAIDDGSARVQYKLGLALFRSGDPRDAIAPLGRAASLDQRKAEPQYALGLCLRHTGHPADAIKAFEQAIRISPALTAAREELAALYAEAGRPREGIDELEAIAALEPNRPERQVAVGLAQARAGRTDLAVGVLGRAAERYPDNSLIYVALGRVWFESAERTRDRVGLRKALEALEPFTHGPTASGEALALYGRALVLSGDLTAGEGALRNAAEILPVSLDTLLQLADAAERLGHYATVRSALERWAAIAPESHPNLPAVYERLGDLSVRLGNPAGAVRAWRLAAGPAASAGLLARLAEAELAAGDEDAARATVARGLSRDPRHPVLLVLQRKLQQPPG
jgi:tetratricopeptide (TPR) repeat protein